MPDNPDEKKLRSKTELRIRKMPPTPPTDEEGRTVTVNRASAQKGSPSGTLKIKRLPPTPAQVGDKTVHLDHNAVKFREILQAAPSLHFEDSAEDGEMKQVAAYSADVKAPKAAPPKLPPHGKDPSPAPEVGRKRRVDLRENIRQPPARAAQKVATDAPPPPPEPWQPLSNDSVLDLEDVCLEQTAFQNRYCDFETLHVDRRGPTDKCYDHALDRNLAMKSLHPRLRDDPIPRRALVREARVLSRLEHLGVPRVYELALRFDGTMYFTKDLPAGLPLNQLLDQINSGDPDIIEKYPLSRRLELFREICDTIRCAHTRNIVHAHLSPYVICVTDSGHVMIDGWENAVLLPEKQAKRPPQPPLEETLLATVAYEAPEAVERRGAALTEPTDVYGLGAILYALLTGEAPFPALELSTLKNAILTEDAPAAREKHREVSKALSDVCEVCLKKERQDRYENVDDILEAIQESIPKQSGGGSKVAMLSMLLLAAIIPAAVVAMTAKKEQVVVEREVSLDAVEAELTAAATQQSDLAQLRRKQETLQNKQISRKLNPEELLLAEAVDREQLALQRKLAAAEALLRNVPNERRNSAWRKSQAELHHIQLKDCLESTPKQFPALLERARPIFAAAGMDELAETLQATLNAPATLKLATEPVAAKISLIALTDVDGVLEEGDPVLLGKGTVLYQCAPGSYVTVLEYFGKKVRLPVKLEPGGSFEQTVALPDKIPQGTEYVPGGPYIAGGDASLRHRKHIAHLPGFFMRTTEVTFGEFFAYWADPSGGNRRSDLVPQLRLLANERSFTPAWDSSGRYVSNVSEVHPVVGITHNAARQYCSWLRLNQGVKAWLPTSRQWEKAARGVDGRRYIWGDAVLSDRAFTLDNGSAQKEFGFLAPVGSLGTDTSVYGIQDLAGNAREWTDTLYSDDNPFFEIRGSSSSTPSYLLPCTASSQSEAVPSDIGFRYIIPFEK